MFLYISRWSLLSQVSSDEAVSLGREDERRLLQHRRLVLLVDLDQTLIHTTNEDIQPNLKNVHHFQVNKSGKPWGPSFGPWVSRLRPWDPQSGPWVLLCSPWGWALGT